MALFFFSCTLSRKWLAKMAKSWRFVAFRDKQCSRPTCHRAAQALLGLVVGLVARFWLSRWGWLADMGPKCGSRFCRSRRSPGDWRTGVSTHHTMASSDVGGRVTDGACSSLAVEWPDPERAVAIRSQSDCCACVHGTGWLCLATTNSQAYA